MSHNLAQGFFLTTILPFIFATICSTFIPISAPGYRRPSWQTAWAGFQIRETRTDDGDEHHVDNRAR